MDIKGKIIESDKAHKRKTFIYPVEHHYEEKGEKPYIKYGCPVCEYVGNKHQVSYGESNCMLCGVNLIWEQECNEINQDKKNVEELENAM